MGKRIPQRWWTFHDAHKMEDPGSNSDGPFQNFMSHLGGVSPYPIGGDAAWEVPNLTIAVWLALQLSHLLMISLRTLLNLNFCNAQFIAS